MGRFFIGLTPRTSLCIMSSGLLNAMPFRTVFSFAALAACLAALAASPEKPPTNEQALKHCLQWHPHRYCMITYGGMQ